jgi:hypothetical protein
MLGFIITFYITLIFIIYTSNFMQIWYWQFVCAKQALGAMVNLGIVPTFRLCGNACAEITIR